MTHLPRPVPAEGETYGLSPMIDALALWLVLLLGYFAGIEERKGYFRGLEERKGK